MVVRGDAWALADARGRGRFGSPAVPVADHAATWGASLVLVLGEPPANLWGPAADVTVTGDTNGAGGRPWRYRVNVPGAAPVTLVIVDRDEGRHAGPWEGLSGAQTVSALRVLRELLGVPWGVSVGRTAEHLILSTHPRHRGGRSLDRAPRIPEPARPARLEQPWTSWQRPLTEYEGSAAWVHTFDANAAFLGPWQTTELGFGVPEHFTTARGCSSRLFLPGVWRVELPAGWHDGDGLPPIAPGLVGGRGWVTTPTLARLREWSELHGWGELTPDEGHVWQQRSRFLRAAGERLRDARAAAMVQQRTATAALLTAETDEDVTAAAERVAVAGAVRDAVRDLYTVAVGRLSSAESHISPGWARPDWGNALRATYRVSLHRKLARLPAAPFAVMTDALAFATDEPDAATFAASIGLRLGDGLGELKHQGTAERAAVVEHLGHGARGLLRAFGVGAR